MSEKEYSMYWNIPYNDLMIRSFVNNLVITEAEEWNLNHFVFDTYALLK